jgi:hypothetical protein
MVWKIDTTCWCCKKCSKRHLNVTHTWRIRKLAFHPQSRVTTPKYLTHWIVKNLIQFVLQDDGYEKMCCLVKQRASSLPYKTKLSTQELPEVCHGYEFLWRMSSLYKYKGVHPKYLQRLSCTGSEGLPSS